MLDLGTKFGLVLGAGGAVGWAYHLGVLEGLEAATGLRPEDAVVTIGTSAGGAIAASVHAGAEAAEILASFDRPIAPEDRARMEEARARRRRRIPFLGRPQSLSMIRRGGAIGLVGLLPAGIFPTVSLRRFPTDGVESWPERLWLTAVRLGDGDVVVFGRDRTDVELADAVEATSAVPALFEPKRIGDERFIDGAVASATHADLLTPLGLDVVVISSPMTRPGRGPVRVRARHQLRQERARLENVGTRTLMVEPDDAIMAVAEGFPRRRPEAGPDIIAAARAQTIAAIEHFDGAVQ